MSRRAATPRKSRNSKAKAAPRNRRLDRGLETAHRGESSLQAGPKAKAERLPERKQEMSRREQRKEDRRIRQEERMTRKRLERQKAWEQSAQLGCVMPG